MKHRIYKAMVKFLALSALLATVLFADATLLAPDIPRPSAMLLPAAIGLTAFLFRAALAQEPATIHGGSTPLKKRKRLHFDKKYKASINGGSRVA